MGRMHTPGKGMSSSALPYKRSPPSWLKITPTEVRRRPCPPPLRSRLVAAGRTARDRGSVPKESGAVARTRLRMQGHRRPVARGWTHPWCPLLSMGPQLTGHEYTSTLR